MKLQEEGAHCHNNGLNRDDKQKSPGFKYQVIHQSVLHRQYDNVVPVFHV